MRYPYLIGLCLILIGVLLILISSIFMPGKKEYGFVAFIGPFPIGFASSKEALYFTLAIGILILAIVLIMLRP